MTDKIPFDVEKWKSGKYEVVTRSGKDTVKSIIMHDCDIDEPLSVVFGNEREAFHVSINGKYYLEEDDPSDDARDLFLTPKKRNVWIAIRKEMIKPDDGFYVASQAYENRLDIPTESDCDAYNIIEVELPDE